MYILYERTGTFVLKRKGEKFSERRIMAVVRSNKNNKLCYSNNACGDWSSSLQADQEFPKPTGSSKNLTDLSGNYRWK